MPGGRFLFGLLALFEKANTFCLVKRSEKKRRGLAGLPAGDACMCVSVCAHVVGLLRSREGAVIDADNLCKL